MRDGATAVVPAGEPLLDPWLRDELHVVTFGPGGDVSSCAGHGAGRARTVLAGSERIELELPFTSAHNLLNTLAAVAAARAVGVTPAAGGRALLGAARRARRARRRRARHQRLLQRQPAVDARRPGRPRPAGARAAPRRRARRHARAGARRASRTTATSARCAATAGVDVLVTVGPRAAEMGARFDGEVHAVADAAAAARLARDLVEPGDVVLVKGSRGVGLEVVAEPLAAAAIPGGTA